MLKFDEVAMVLQYQIQYGTLIDIVCGDGSTIVLLHRRVCMAEFK